MKEPDFDNMTDQEWANEFVGAIFKSPNFVDDIERQRENAVMVGDLVEVLRLDEIMRKILRKARELRLIKPDPFNVPL